MRLITLKDWAQQQFGVQYSAGTLNKWAREGFISPAPRKIGRQWLVHPNAQYLEKTIEAERTARAQKELSRQTPSTLNLNSKLLRIINNESSAA